jgi:hypothetical protein
LIDARFTYCSYPSASLGTILRFDIAHHGSNRGELHRTKPAEGCYLVLLWIVKERVADFYKIGEIVKNFIGCLAVP